MPFPFLKYLQPNHYFILPRYRGGLVYPEDKKLPKSVLDQLTKDTTYVSDQATAYDASWQAVQLGYIGLTKTLGTIADVPLIDNYRFIRKYFHPAWVFYVLVLRILGLHNPMKECAAWLKTRPVKRSPYLQNPIKQEGWDAFKSLLIASRPKVSVIIPTLNRYDYLKDVLADLERQDFPHFEVLIVDQSDNFQESFYTDFKLDLKVFNQKEKALWQARNFAIRKSEGDYLLFFDDDSRVAPDWISMHLACLDYFKADVSSGVSISKVGAEVPKHYTFFKVSDQLDTGNALIKKSVFKHIGLFDRQFEKQRMGDGEFGLRVYLNGYLNVSNPYAQRLHLKVGTGGLREMGSWDAFRTNKWLAPRPIPSVLYFFRRYFGTKAAVFALLRTVPLSIMPYQLKKNKAMLAFGVVVCFLLIPLVLFQVYKSWSLASVKLQEGPLIDSLA